MTNSATNAHSEHSVDTRVTGAFLGAAIGDALGMPQEGWLRRNRGAATPPERPEGFREWKHTGSGRFWESETIKPGEYSDDTQLMMVTARSLLRGENWWEALTRCELPMSRLYIRGEGRATKFATDAWLSNRFPWKNQNNYFEAGANGVVMRILPHCLLGHQDSDFTNIAKGIMADGIATHGHPRALAGALAYGYAVWRMLNGDGPDELESLIPMLLERKTVWSLLPDVADYCSAWKEAAGSGYESRWGDGIEELLNLLETLAGCKKTDSAATVLHKIGCFDRETKGAGTVTAAGAVFLASRYAWEPLDGVAEPAFSYGADSDTLASVTGGLLGAAHGLGWLGDYPQQVQDGDYIKKLSRSLLAKELSTENSAVYNPRIDQKDLDEVKAVLKEAEMGRSISLPDGRQAAVCAVEYFRNRFGKLVCKRWTLNTGDGQTIYIKHRSKDGYEDTLAVDVQDNVTN